MTVLEILNAPWAIEPAKLREIQSIYAAHTRGEKIDLAEVEARLQRPLANEQQEYVIRDGGVAVLPIEGVIAAKANLFTRISGGASAQMLQTQLESAVADPRVRSVILEIDSPGGSIFGTPELAAAVLEMAKVKPIVAVGTGLMASAAYWIASAANAVYISGLTVHAGSIGVVATHSFNPRVAEGTTEITAGKYKRIASDMAPLTDEGRAYIQQRVDHIYTVFVDAVAQHRGVDAATVLEHMADGRVFVGQQALDAGLVDGVATVDQVAEKLASKPEAYARRRKAAIRAQDDSPPPGAPAPIPTPPKGNPAMNREELAAQHPELLNAILAEGRAEGAAAERARIQSVEAALIPGHEALIASLKFDGKTSGGDAAMAVNAAERKLRESQRTAAAAEAPKPVPQAAAPAVDLGGTSQQAAEAERLASLPLEERCKAQWEATPKLRDEFATLAAYTAFERAAAAGRARIKAA